MAEFKLGRLRFVWQGEWTTGTAYVKDDIVRYGGSSFVCINAHTAAADFYTNFDVGAWELMSSGLQWRTEPWETGTWYAENDVVRYGGKLYISINGHIASADFNTDFDNNQWQLFTDGTEWKTSEWSAGQLYKEGDLVRHGGKVYICIDGHTSGSSFKTDKLNSKWQLFADGVQWKTSDWSINTLYKDGDVVRYGGKTYICIDEHTSSGTVAGGFYSDLMHWQLFTDGFAWRGTWSATSYYKQNDLVRYGAKTYNCVSGHTANTDFYVDFDASRWELFNDGQQWKALPWTVETLYKEGDLVRHGGRVHICVNGHTSSSDAGLGFNADYTAGNWQIFVTGFDWKNVWFAGTFYKLSDVVRYGAKSYICVEAHEANSDFYVDVDNQKWELITDGQQWKTSAWTEESLYKEGDLVRYGGRVYICVNGHTATATTNRFDLDFDAGNWQLFSDGQQWKTTPWTAGVYYKTGDIIRYGGKTYIAVNDHLADSNQDGGFYTNLTGGEWQLFADGTEWVGDWVVNTYYKVGDIVRYDGNTYICNTGHTSAATIEDGLEADLGVDPKWDVYTEGFKFKGDWASSTKYNINDVVRFGGSLYICVVYHTSTAQFSEPNWNVLIGGLQFEDTWNVNVEYQLGDIVTYGGYSYVAKVRNTGKIPSTYPDEWDLLSTGFKVQGEYSSTTSYKVGDVVHYGGTTYVATVDHAANSKPVQANGSLATGWEVVAGGINWRAEWLENQEYKVGDAVRWISNSYICKKDHNSATAGTRPDVDGTGTYWDSLVEGAEGNSLTRRGDLVTRNAIKNVRLPIGGAGQVLVVDGPDVAWGYFNQVDNVYYVKTDGVDGPERGTTLETAFATLKYATDYILADEATRAPATIYVKTGTYTEILPIIIPANVAIVGDELRSTRIQPAEGYETSDMFYMRDGSGLRNCTLSGLTGTLGSINSYGTRRPTAGAYTSLDPGTGPGDESVWIVNRSPYVQNVTNFGTGCTGLKIDGTLHNGGNKTIVCNDYTQVLNDGIGIWCTNNARVENVSVFCYYNHIGYLAENGGVIRSTNGNSSYGDFGIVAEGVDSSEVSRIATVNNRRLEAQVANTITDGDGVVVIEYSNAGQGYTVGGTTYTFSGSGAANTIVVDTPVVQNQGVMEVRVLDAGTGWTGVINNAQSGNDLQIRISASDVALNNAYNGCRVFIINGVGVGQYGYITKYTSGVNIAMVAKESFTPLVATATAVTSNRITVGSSSTLTVNMPVVFTGSVGLSGISADTVYYVLDKPTSTTFRITDTSGGTTPVTLATVSGLSLTVHAAGWESITNSAIQPTLDTTTRYSIEPRVKFSTGSGATATGLISKGLDAISITGGSNSAGAYYQSAPTVVISGTETNSQGAIGVAQISGEIERVEIRDGGTGFTGTPNVQFIGGNPSVAATGTANVVRTIKTVAVTNGGSGYHNPPKVLISGDGYNDDGYITANLTNVVGEIIVTDSGSGYTTPPTVTITGGGGVGATAIALLHASITGFTILEGGSGYTGPTTTVSFVNAPGDMSGAGATAGAVIDNGLISTVTITEPGSGYVESDTTISVVDLAGNGSGAVLNYTLFDGAFDTITVVDPGSGYVQPKVVITSASGTNAVLTPTLVVTTGTITSIVVINEGSGYEQAPTVVITDTRGPTGFGVDASATALIVGGISSVKITNGGRDYNNAPQVAFSSGTAAATAVVLGSVASLSIIEGGTGFTSPTDVTLTIEAVSDFVYDNEKCARDVGLLVNAVTTDIVINSNVQSVKAGQAYLRSYSSVVLENQLAETVAAIERTKLLTQNATDDLLAKTKIGENFDIITSIIQGNPAPTLTYPALVGTSTGISNASLALIANKEFLKEEVIAWINKQIADNAAEPTSPWFNFTYNSATCARDTGYLVEALTYDILYSSNVLSREFGFSYYEGVNNVIPGQQAQSIAAYEHLKSIISNVIQGIEVIPTTGNIQIQNLSNAGSAAAGTTAEGLIDLVNDIVLDGTTAIAEDLPTLIGGLIDASVKNAIDTQIPTIQTTVVNWINATYVGANATATATLHRTVKSVTITNGSGYTSTPTVAISGGGGTGALARAILNSSITGVTVTAPGKNYTTLPTVAFSGGHNFKSIVSGEAYYRNTSALNAIGPLQLEETLFAIDYIKNLASAIANDLDPMTSYQDVVFRTGTGTAPAGAYDQTVFWIDVVKAIAENGGKLEDAAFIISSNRDFIAAEVVAWATANISGFSWSASDLRKRAGLLVDALVADFNTGTVEKTVAVGEKYGLLFAGENAATLSVLTHFEDLVQDVISNTPITVTNTDGETQTLIPLLVIELITPTAVTNNINLIRSIVNLNGVTGDIGNSSYTDLLLANKTWIKAEIIERVKSAYPNFEYNQVLCARDIGLIVDAIAHDVRYSQIARAKATATTTNVLSEITVVTGGSGYGAGTTVSFTGDLGTGSAPSASPIITNGVITGFTITQPGKGYSVAPNVTVNADIGSGAFARAYILGEVVNEFRIIHPGSGYSAAPYISLVDPNNTADGEFQVRVANGVLDQPTFISRGTGYTAVSTSVSGSGLADIYQTGEFVYVDNLTNIPTPGANVTFEGNDQYYKLVTIREVQGPSGIIGGRNLILANKEFVKAQIIAHINSTYPDLNYNQTLCARDVGYILDAIGADIFGDTEKGIEAGKRYYANASAIKSITDGLGAENAQKTATIAAINKIDDYLQDIVQNIDVVRNQLVQLQVKEPLVTAGADAILPMQATLDIIKNIINTGNTIFGVSDLLQDNKEYIKAEVIAFVNTAFPDFTYNEALCSRDVGLMLDAITYDLFGGLARSREAGLRYYANSSALIAITTQKTETLAAINHFLDVALSVAANEPPAVIYQNTVQQIVNPAVVVTNDLLTKIDECVTEVIAVINGGSGVLPAGRYSARLQVSPALTVTTVPSHNASITIRSKYSQVRLTGHDFLNVGTGNKASTNYPGIPVLQPAQENEVREAGGGRCFYSSTDQDGNFRVGELFKVEQSTGIASLNAQAFNLSGLNELSLGGIVVGGTGAVINEFSTDGTFFANSDNIVPTQRAIRTFIQSQLGSGGGNLTVNAVTAGDVQITANSISVTAEPLIITVPVSGVKIDQVIASTNTTTGSLVVAGGVGVGGALNVASDTTIGGDLVVTGTLSVNGRFGEMNVTTLTVDDNAIELGTVVSQSNISGTISGTGTSTTITGMNSTSGLIPGQTLTKTSGTGAFGGLTTITSVDSATQITIKSTTTNTVGSITFSVNGANDNSANNGGIVLHGATDKSLTWLSNTGRWTSNVGFEATVIDNTPIGSNTRAAGAFTTLTANNSVTLTAGTASSGTSSGTLVVTGGIGASGNVNVGGTLGTVGLTATGTVSMSPDNASVTASPTGTGGVTISPTGTGGLTINPTSVGTINNTSIGASTRSTGAFTTLAANDSVTFTKGTGSTSTTTGTLVVTGGVGISERLYAANIENTPIGANTRSTGAFTTLDANSTVGLSGSNAAVTISPTGTGSVTISPTGSGGLTINPTTTGTINNTSIGASTRSTGAFTTLTANNAVTFTANTASSSTSTGTLVVTGGVGLSGNLNVGGNTVINGDLTVNGVTTAINTNTLQVDDKNIDLGAVSAVNGLTGTITTSATTSTITGLTSTAGLIPGMALTKTAGAGVLGTSTVITSVDSATQITVTGSTAHTAGSITFNAGGATDTTANGAGITVKGATDKTLTWVQSTGYWTFNQGLQATSIQNTPIGSSTANTGAFTSLTANAAVTFTQNTASTSTSTGTLVVTGGLGVSGRINAANFDGVIGANSAAAGSFTTITASSTADFNGAVTIDGANVSATISPTGTGTVTINPATAGTINNMSIGASTRASGSFTTLTANNAVTFTQNTGSTSTTSGTLIVTGGVGISENLYVGGTAVRFSGNTASSSTSTGTLVVTGGVGISGNIYSGGSAVISGNTASTSTTTGTVIVTGGVGVSGALYAGSLNATTKSFVIDHPTKEGMKLQYASLEGPENGVYVRGRITGSSVIELPDYWTGLVDAATITVNLTPVGSYQQAFVEKIEGNKVYISGATDCFYTVYGERKDVAKLTVEYKA